MRSEELLEELRKKGVSEELVKEVEEELRKPELRLKEELKRVIRRHLSKLPSPILILIEVEKGEIKIDIEEKQKFTEAEISISTKVTLEELKHRVKPGAKPPKAVIFPDGTKQRLESWRSLLVNIARWAVTHISKEKIPIKAGSSRFLLHTENRHPHGREFFNPERVGDLWLETHFNSPRCVSLACRLLREAGFSPSQVKVEGWELLEE